jgi:hypothetical protein
MPAVVLLVPGDADFLTAGQDEVIGMRILGLVVVGLKRDIRLDGECVELAGKAVFSTGERADDSADFFINNLLLNSRESFIALSCLVRPSARIRRPMQQIEMLVRA